MFNHLIESNSHRKEFKRRGSFILFTLGVYSMLFVVTGVVSIYAYDAHLEEQTTELQLLTFVPLQDNKPPAPAPPRNTINTPSHNGATSQSVRTTLYDSVSNPNNIPHNVSSAAVGVPPARSDSVIGSYNADPVGPRSTTSGTGDGGPAVAVSVADPPPAPVVRPAPAPAPKVIRSSVVLNSKALTLPKPNYPAIAKQIHQQGTVTVQVLIDEQGSVVSAKAVVGPPLLILEAQKAALQARFSPTMIGGTPVKVSGVITYNFVLQ